MEQLFSYEQNKKTDKGKQIERVSLEIYFWEETIQIKQDYDYSYKRPKDGDNDIPEYTLVREVEMSTELTIDLKKANYRVWNSTVTKGFFGDIRGMKKPNISKNRFDRLAEFTTEAFYKGNKRGSGKWGKRYSDKVDQAFIILKDLIQPRIKDDYLRNKMHFHKTEIDPLFDLLVDYHLDKKNIKGHDLIYLDIQTDYPKLKYLKLNDYKFVPSVLDGYGIKTKQFISTLNNNTEGLPIIIKSLNYICKLFGDNFIDYLNKVDWHLHCYRPPRGNKTHLLKNDTEKKNMMMTIINWEKENMMTDSFVDSLYNLLSLRQSLEKKGIDLRYTATNDLQFRELEERWLSVKKYISRGYRVRYVFKKDFIKYIEQDILIGDEVYKPKILSTEEEFKVEGHIMKNCMGQQFNHGAVSVYVSLRKGKKWINVQYKSGDMTMAYGKANSPIPDEFKIVVDTLTKRFKKQKNISWVKEKYDLI
mgnify:FL=1|jgi:hypothetical protein|tara:strand:+ start:1307 stop:2731 length:1425 start_codon:yes stop_codon:yes gene_type:complete